MFSLKLYGPAAILLVLGANQFGLKGPTPSWTKPPTSHFWLDDPSLFELHDKKLGFNTRINGPCLDKI